MYRWSACPGSIRMCAGVKEQESAYAKEGTLAHEIAAEVLQNKGWRKNTDPAMKQHLGLYISALRSEGFDRRKPFHLIEHRFDLSMVFPGMFGTADAVIWHPEKLLLQIFDLKFGAGIPVVVRGNKQLLYYALGALMSLGLPAKEVEIGVVQPRCPHIDGHVRKWRLPAIELLDFEAELVEAAKRTQDPNAPLISGDHCRFCPASATCPQLFSSAQALAVQDFSPATDYNPVDLGLVLEKIDVFESWCHNVRAFAYSEAQRGRVPPGWKLVEKRPTRQWKSDVTATALGKKFEKTDTAFLEVPSLKSPAQVEKLIDKSELILLEQFYEKKSSGTKLVKESEPGVPIAIGPAKEFEVIDDIFT
jgi:hypothetical protein